MPGLIDPSQYHSSPQTCTRCGRTVSGLWAPENICSHCHYVDEISRHKAEIQRLERIINRIEERESDATL